MHDYYTYTVTMCYDVHMHSNNSVVYKRLASLLSSKHDEHYSKTILFIRSKLSFALLRSAVRCLRGARSIFKSDFGELNIGLALTEGRVTYWSIFFSHYLFQTFTTYFAYLGKKKKKKKNPLDDWNACFVLCNNRIKIFWRVLTSMNLWWRHLCQVRIQQLHSHYTHGLHMGSR